MKSLNDFSNNFCFILENDYNCNKCFTYWWNGHLKDILFFIIARIGVVVYLLENFKKAYGKTGG